jgi:hypothetical protein
MSTKHPVLKQHGFTAKTPPLIEFVEEFSRLLEDGELSMVYYGRQRYGKTSARSYLVKALAASKETVTVVVWASVQRDVRQRLPRDRLWRDLLRGNGGKANWLSTKPYDTLLKWLLVEAESQGTDIVVIILDESQNLSLEGLGDLKKLVDDLIDHELSPFVVLGAQPEILLRPKRLIRFNKEDLVDRFFTNIYRFRGVLPEEFAEVLAHYDTAKWDGKTYTEHFLPKLWAQGWRLASHAGTCRDAFSHLNQKIGTGTEEVGMKYLATAVRRFFLDIGDTLPPLEKQQEVARAAVASCGLVRAWTAVGNSEKRAQAREREDVDKRLGEASA